MCDRLSSIDHVPGRSQTAGRMGAAECQGKLLCRAGRSLSLGRLWVRRPGQLLHPFFLLILIVVIHIILVIIIIVILRGGGSACGSHQHHIDQEWRVPKSRTSMCYF